MADIDYKAKYYALRDKLIRVMDFSYREGYEAGAKEAQMNSLMQQQQQQAAMAQQQAQMMGGEQEQEMPQEAGQEATPEAGPSEDMDEYIQELESLVSKGEISSDDLKKSLEKIKAHSVKLKRPKPLRKLSAQVSKNMPQSGKEALTKQHMIVENVLKKWEEESQQAISDMGRLIGVDTIVKKG
jgi:hypothetical protein